MTKEEFNTRIKNKSVMEKMRREELFLVASTTGASRHQKKSVNGDLSQKKIIFSHCISLLQDKEC